MIFDTHAHYYDEAFDADRDALLASLPGRGWPWWSAPAAIWSPPASPSPWRSGTAFSTPPPDTTRRIWRGRPSPTWTPSGHCAPTRRWWRWGEIGLDYYWLKTPEERANSRDFFDAQLSLAEELNLPAIVHDRDAHRDCLDIVRAHPGVRGVFHCYSGSLEDAKVLVDKGWMLSFTGNITFKNARRAPDILRWLPLDRLMLETDAPYMAPEPYRGQRCDAETVAQLRGLTRDEVEAVTLENGKKFFGIA